MNTKYPLSAVLIAAIAISLIGLIGIGCSSSGSHEKGIADYVRAVQAYNKGDRDKAVQNLVVATRTSPDLIMARLMLGDLYREGGEYNNAITQYEKLVKLDPYTWSNYYKLGVSYQFVQRLTDATASYKKALSLNPDDADSNMNLGLVYLYLGNADDAVTYCQRATLLNPKSASAFSNLGVALDAKGDYPRAEAAYRHSLDLDPNNDTTMLNLGTNLIAQNKGAEAVEIMEQVIKMSDSPLHRKRYGDALAKAGRYDDAIAQYQAALRIDPKYYPAMNEIGNSRIAQYKDNLELDDDRRLEAIAIWDQSLAINPNQPRIIDAKKQWSQKKMFGR